MKVVFKPVKVKPEVEPVGPTPMPSITELRSWDFRLLDRYRPFYLPFCDMCCLCTYGKCDLTSRKRGVCGVDIEVQQARMNLLTATIGASTHAAHARTLVEHLINKFGKELPLQAGDEVVVKAPIIKLVTGIDPRVLGDLKKVLDYIENQITHLLAATQSGQEGNCLDFESKALHAGMIDNLSLEVADLAQISAYNLPKGESNIHMVEIGLGVVDITKPVTLSIGHNVSSSAEIVDYLKKSELMDSLEVTGLCCTGHDIARYYEKAKIIGSIAEQVRFVRSGIADVLILDEQCIRTDLLVEAQKVKSPLIAATDKVCLGLPDMTDFPVERIVWKLVNGANVGALILDPKKVGEVAVKTAISIAPKRDRDKCGTLPNLKTLKKYAEKCEACESCKRNCPMGLSTTEAIDAASKGNFDKLAKLHELCIGCVRCESECPNDIPILSLIEKAAEYKIKTEKYKIRVGRGFIRDTEIRKVGAPIVLGEIPGVIGFVGCANYPKGGIDVAKMAEEFLKRRYIVVTSGCSAMAIAQYKNEEGKTLYEQYPPDFDAGGLVNVGSCVSNAHIIGAAIKIANIYARRNLRANYEEIADYVLNRVGAVAIAWGAMSQKALAIATGANRLGIPVIVGPHGSKYRRFYLGRKDKPDKFMIYDARTGEKVFAGPSPEHLACSAESKEEAMVSAAKLTIRPNDTTKGRQLKLSHYIDLHMRYYGTMPDDVHLFIRDELDVPITMKDEILEILKEKRWKPTRIPDPTLLKRMIRGEEG